MRPVNLCQFLNTDLSQNKKAPGLSLSHSGFGVLRFEGRRRSVEEKMSDLRQRLTEVKHFDIASSTLSFDQETRLPKNAKANRGAVMGTLAKYAHQLFTDSKLGRLLKSLNQPKVLSKLPDEVDRALVRVAAEGYDKATKFDAAFVAKFSEACSNAHNAWVEARKENNFEKFQPHLEKLVELSKERAQILHGNKPGPVYNALLNEYEEGATVEQLDKVFKDLREGLVPLVKAIGESKYHFEPRFLNMPEGTYPKEKQVALNKKVAEDLGFDFNSGVMDEVTHPFCSGIDSPFDVRANTRYRTTDFTESLTGITHEVGHGLYEQGVNRKLAGTILASGVSLGIHESQSRLLENQIGKSRPFWKHYLPLARKYFPKPLKGVTVDDFYRGLNQVKPSLIRVESDEVTYNLHVMVRYELEKALFENKLEVKDLPKAWNEKMKEYLGVEPKTNAEGVLQDVHWSGASFGYFPTYTIGNLLSAQLFQKMKQELGEKHGNPRYVEQRMSKGDFKEIREWLREKVHDAGAIKKPAEIILQATGEPLNAKYFIDYLWDKYSEIYPDIKGKRPA